MGSYILRRLLLIFPTLFGILLLNFALVQVAPGGPVEQIIAQVQGFGGNSLSRVTGESSDFMATENRGEVTQGVTSQYAGAQGLDPQFIKDLEKQFGFDKPPAERFWLMMKNFLKFDLGKSYFKGRPVTELIFEKLPVSITLGLWSTLFAYLISIPLGIRKAVRDGSSFDVWTSGAVIVGYAVPAFLFAIFLIVLFAGGTFFKVFPLRGLVSDNFDELSTLGQVGDYLWHMTLPVLAMTISGFASLTLLTKNSFLSEVSKNYVLTAQAKGCTEKRVLYGHIFRNAMLIIVAGMPAAFISMLFTGALLIEVVFSLDGLGLLGFEAAMSRDYPVMFGTLYLFTLLSLVLHLIGDITYTLVDPRIDFEKRGG